ncbi:PadR family transcriptional regulator [Desulfosporosinus sp. BG]|uniref:PadR family transcriptional regulator n=1 Tax=Desulfosporosinus sp. BG TaxID=1633135 RepID=UPI000855D563|nr:PadR family transcriptional regulator [Desulfosporosinus sp. BG]ODA39518.1 hypothetical protein DSBG_3690 [Desulfosporosinus sp. BG]
MNKEKVSESELNIPIERSIQAELLLLLGQRPTHGYELIQRLSEDYLSNSAYANFYDQASVIVESKVPGKNVNHSC